MLRIVDNAHMGIWERHKKAVVTIRRAVFMAAFVKIMSRDSL